MGQAFFGNLIIQVPANTASPNAPKLINSKPLPAWFPKFWLSSKPRKVLIVAHGGKAKGLSFGHLSRCKVISKQLSKVFGSECRFGSKDYPEGIAYLKENGLAYHPISRELSPEEESIFLVNLIQSYGANWVIIDSPLTELLSSFYKRIKKSGIHTLYLDDSKFSPPEVDIYHNSSIVAEEKMLERNKTTEYLLGPRYMIMPEAPFPPMETRWNKDENHIVVTLSFGGSDPCGYTAKVLRAIREHLPPQWKIRAILGPGFQLSRAFETACEGFSERVLEVIQNPKEPYAYFLDSSLVICAGGRTLYELYALKVPCLPIASIDHEKEHILGFHKQIGLEPYLLEWSDKAFIQKFNSVMYHLESKRNKFESSLYPPT